MKVRVVWKSGSLFQSLRDAEAEAPPSALVDVRSHIFWGLGDGPQNLDESIAMVHLAAAHGTTDIVATPSASFEYGFDSTVIAQRLEQLRAHCDGSIRIHTGCDFHFGFGNI